jgi:hypothetical protein
LNRVLVADGEVLGSNAATEHVAPVVCYDDHLSSDTTKMFGCRYAFGPYYKPSAVEQGADKAKPPVRGGFIWFPVRTLGPDQLHLYGDRFRECETKD